MTRRPPCGIISRVFFNREANGFGGRTDPFGRSEQEPWIGVLIGLAFVHLYVDW